ncbi:MAG TPA: Holliday junction resolvase RuvX [Acidimicrobiales bacterium]|nr:Holliday junction resolvase RuvX [Acidimicrobiales bacterium]
MIGLDLGARRIGVAVSDAGGTLASPRGAIARTADATDHRRAVAALVEEVGAGRVIVGLPLSMSGATGEAAKAAIAEAAALAEVVDVPVETCDERLTTVTAARALRQGGVKGRDQRSRIDGAAAAVMLQAWLDGHRALERGDHP